MATLWEKWRKVSTSVQACLIAIRRSRAARNTVEWCSHGIAGKGSVDKSSSMSHHQNMSAHGDDK
eukprot:1105596-Pelagomonas_calceolata.AAC.2